VTRVALAVIVFCSTLCAAFGQLLPGSPAAPESSRAATTTHASLDCTSTDDDREWIPQRDAPASITESVWKWRSLRAGVAASTGPDTIVATSPGKAAPMRATGARSHLLHIPLLI
jgi:hypothetical protein